MSIELQPEPVRDRLQDPGRGIPVFTVSSFGDYCGLTEIIRHCWTAKSNERIGYVGEILPWFRGVNNKEYTLTPKLARLWTEYSKLYRSIYDLEDYFYDRFTRFGRPFLGGIIPQDEIEWNYIMRHHEIPSRLLDWTKGSLIALSYATQGSLKVPKDLYPEVQPGTASIANPDQQLNQRIVSNSKDAAVWMLEPRRLMEAATSCLKLKGGSEGTRNIASREKKIQAMRRDFFRDPSSYQESEALGKELTNFPWNEEYWEYPLPLIPSHISARVESHLSRFTLHSLSTYRSRTQQEPPERDNGMYNFATKAFEKDTFWYLVKIEFPGSQLKSIARALRMTGVGDMNFTQDLDGLSRELQMRAHLGYVDDGHARPIS